MFQTSFSYKPSHFWWLLALLALMLLFRLGASPIYILDEAKNAQCAREMLQRNDWVVPTFNGELRTDKPVLHYYFMMLAYKVFGVNESAARFFSAILGICTVIVTYYFTKRFINAATAFASALVLVASTHFLFEFRLSVPDPYLIFFVTAGLLTAYTYLDKNNFVYLLFAAVSFALATLAKGPVALALPGLCLLIWVIIKNKWSLLFTWKLIPALILLVAIIFPWYIAVDKATHHAWTSGFFIEHNLNRFSNPTEGHGGIFLVTILFIIIGLLPFTSFLIEVTKSRKLIFTEDLVKFSGIVVLAFVAFFSVSSTKLPNYPMPCYPFAAIILGKYLSGFFNAEITIEKCPFYILLVFGLLIPVAGFFGVAQEKEIAFLNWVTLFLLIAPVVFLAIIILWKNISNYQKILSVAAAFTLFNIVALQIVYPTLYKQNPVAKTLVFVQEHPIVYAYKPISKTPYYKYRSNRYSVTEDEGEFYNPAFNFYLNQPVIKFFNIDTLKAALITNPSAIIIGRTQDSGDLQQLNLTKVAEHHDLFESPTTILYVTRNQP
jgi:4-amino-4-deoxy-L-arabinose transferase-like glycosyltransferase